MYVVLITYTAPLEEIDYVLPDHAEWLGKQYAAGYFLASGRQKPHTGGVVIAAPMSKDKLVSLLATDPFAQRGLVHHEVIEFQANRTCRSLMSVNEALLSKEPMPY
ncbi:MAG: YciI family protein [Actinomycetota bacterium]|nr:YciI family protein [Actinomycetota bacterium]